MKMPSPRGVWVPPRPCDGGTPTSFVGTAAGVVSSSAFTTASTSSMTINTFSGFKSVCMIYLEGIRCMSLFSHRTCLIGHSPHPTTPMNIVESKKNLFSDLLDNMFRNASILIPLYQA